LPLATYRCSSLSPAITDLVFIGLDDTFQLCRPSLFILRKATGMLQIDDTTGEHAACLYALNEGSCKF